MATTIFMSDLHLMQEDHAKTQLFADLLKQWQHDDNIDEVYILGDLFDYWLGDDDENEFIIAVKEIFTNFSQYKPIYFIHGNHDFAIGKKFAAQTGLILLPDCSVITKFNQRILLSHGDCFCSHDVAYQITKKIIRQRLLLFVLLHLPLKWRYKIKDILQNTKIRSKIDDKKKYYVVDATISKIATQQQASIVIHGHTHTPGHYQITTTGQTLERYEIPDWGDMKRGGYISVSATGVSIQTKNKARQFELNYQQQLFQH